VPAVCKSYDNFQHEIEKQCRQYVAKGSEQSFCILTQHVTIVSVDLVRRINFVILMDCQSNA
jgi:hypothetical protein